MKTVAIGVDPGQTGAVAVMKSGVIVQLNDMPVSARLHGKGQEVNGAELASILRNAMIIAGDAPIKLFLEAVSSMPTDGGVQAFRFGESVGIVKGVVKTLGIPMSCPTPQEWKKLAKLIKKPKDASRTLAIQLHPEVAGELTRAGDNGRSDAICIAHFMADK